MARKQQEPLTPKQQALRDLDEARASLAHHASLAAEEWSPRALLTRSVEKHRALWIGGAVVGGLALVRLLLPTGGDSSRKNHEGFLTGGGRGLLALLMGPLLALARKSVLSYGSQLVETYLRQKVSPNEPDDGAV